MVLISHPPDKFACCIVITDCMELKSARYFQWHYVHNKFREYLPTRISFGCRPIAYAHTKFRENRLTRAKIELKDRQKGHRASLTGFFINSGRLSVINSSKKDWKLKTQIRGNCNLPHSFPSTTATTDPGDTHSLHRLCVAAKHMWNQQTYTNKVYSDTEFVLMRDWARQNRRRHR
jgi:hypothetical protein